MNYRLGIVDQSFVPKQVTVSYVAICAGAVDDDVLRRAFALTSRRFPVLRGRLEARDGSCYLRLPDSGCGDPVVEIVHGTLPDWLDDVQAIDPMRALAKLEIVRDGETTAVALRIAHAVNDAHLGFELLEEFWRNAAALGACVPVADPAPVVPRSLEDLLAERGIDVPESDVPELRGLYSFAPAGSIGRPGLRLAAESRIMLSAAETGELLRRARAHGTTVHALLSAAIVRSERALIDETPDRTELPMIIGHAVDLRPHLTPPAHPTEATNGLGFAPTITMCGADTDLRVLAENVKAQIVHGIDSGGALATMFAAARLDETDVLPATVNIITNWGVVPALAVPGGMRMVDFRGFATGGSRREISYFVYTFQGRLSIDFTFSETCHSRSRIAELSRILAAEIAVLTATAAVA
ncbi:phthiocerol/phthiodiolone dimycocerosyl transferase family protein [Nocardia yamanashiensis]|uniref:phthiocerol/phthiodiolone dimycocerosyl transferase family protein n=1 Tax=Nocardia yamanashiensis TaxID=209247 RepID=UPI00082DEB54|nr:hypothetical protein [Nocardia yamanashiensis]